MVNLNKIRNRCIIKSLWITKLGKWERMDWDGLDIWEKKYLRGNPKDRWNKSRSKLGNGYAKEEIDEGY